MVQREERGLQWEHAIEQLRPCRPNDWAWQATVPTKESVTIPNKIIKAMRDPEQWGRAD